MKKKELVKILIVDDESDFSELLEMYIRKIGFNKILVADNYKKAKSILDNENPDVALLDIELGSEKSGIDLGVYIKEAHPDVRIIYFTNNFEEQIFDAVKPIQPHAFLDKQLSELKVRQAIELSLLEKIEEDISSLNTELPKCYLAKEFIFVKVGQVFKKLELKEILYIFYADRYANIQVDNKIFALNIPMKDLSLMLPDHHFIQIHQSYIINIHKVSQISLLNNQIEIAEKLIPIGVSFRKNLQKRLTFLT